MLNSSEEFSYWYLRLNGFFIINNFVIHKSVNVRHSSDTDLIAIRTPFVYEEIGGKEDDWDSNLFQNFDRRLLIGIVCQVKGGKIGNKQLFREPYLSYSIQRLGLSSDIETITSQLSHSPRATFINELGQPCQVAKLLITRDEPTKDINYFWFSLDYVYDFIEQRIRKYPIEKYRDRNFFSSIGLQTLIEINKRDEILKRKNNR